MTSSVCSTSPRHTLHVACHSAVTVPPATMPSLMRSSGRSTRIGPPTRAAEPARSVERAFDRDRASRVGRSRRRSATSMRKGPGRNAAEDADIEMGSVASLPARPAGPSTTLPASARWGPLSETVVVGAGAPAPVQATDGIAAGTSCQRFAEMCGNVTKVDEPGTAISAVLVEDLGPASDSSSSVSRSSGVRSTWSVSRPRCGPTRACARARLERGEPRVDVVLGLVAQPAGVGLGVGDDLLRRAAAPPRDLGALHHARGLHLRRLDEVVGLAAAPRRGTRRAP